MSSWHVIGIDPGLVHTGVVGFTLAPDDKRVDVDHLVVDGPDVHETRRWIDDVNATVFVEAYRPRSHFSVDTRMVTAVQEFRTMLQATVVSNTGIKKVVKRPLMDLLDVWQFPTTTHHQDLRAAARIGLLGMLKTPQLNRIVHDLVLDHWKGDDWDIRS